MPMHIDTGWIKANWHWCKVKPALRSALAAWIAMVLFLIPTVQRWLGQAGFLILIASVLSPPAEPFVVVFERETIICIFVAASWAWSCLGIFAASKARSTIIPASEMTVSPYHGEYIEAAPGVILGVFLVLGTCVLLFIKARQGPGPYTFATLLGCICMDISLTTAHLFPYPFYDIGQAIIVPVTLHTAIALLTSILFFPSPVSALFVMRMGDVIASARTNMRNQIGLLEMVGGGLQWYVKEKDDGGGPPGSPVTENGEGSSAQHCADKREKVLGTSDKSGAKPAASEEALATTPSFDDALSKLRIGVKGSEALLVPLASAGRLMKSDLVYGRVNPLDFKDLQATDRKLAVRSDGMTLYWGIVERERDGVFGRHMNWIRRLEGAVAFTHLSRLEIHLPSTPQFTLLPVHTPTHNDHHHHFHHTLTSHLSHLSHSLSSLHLHLPTRKQPPVGVFESMGYLLAEPDLFPKYDERSAFTPAAMAKILSSTCLEVVREVEGAMAVGEKWVREGGRWGRWREVFAKIGVSVGRAVKGRKSTEERLEGLRERRERMRGVLERFQMGGRHRVLDPYRPILESDYPGTVLEGEDIPPHRYLFHCYVYQSHLIRYCQLVLQLLDEIIHIAETRRTSRLWTPAERLLFRWNDRWKAPETLDKEDDENPEHIPGIRSSWDEDFDQVDIGLARKRNPDFLPARNAFEWVMDRVYRCVAGLGGGNVLFAIKAGALGTNKFVWALIMAQLTLARFRGDTVFGFTARIISTFLGGLVGLLIWYIGSEEAEGIPSASLLLPSWLSRSSFMRGCTGRYVLCRVSVVVAANSHEWIWVVGYSYQDEYQLTASSPGVGWAVAWDLLLLATIYYNPVIPTHHALTTVSELRAVYCSVDSFANSRKDYDMTEIIRTLTAIRAKLNRSLLLKTNAIYEFSLRGRWPAKRYHRVLELQMELAYSLSHLLTTIEKLEPSWTGAFLVRSVAPLGSRCMIATALRTGTPLPQITPCPLISRIGQKAYGLNIIQHHAEDDFGLPRTLTKETLENEQYMMLCVATSTTFKVVAALDKLMIATKEIVGEHYHIHGMSMDPRRSASGGVPLE
ncbi:hypothetical protein BDV98DRAFT_587243 [Pterulicium gracile]|uniref:ER transporter 6TM N-terminal domain-containing protein n=1 Tax=Pterulicium gracile TaxID=1884261 RepID=A0A5C3PZX9_9AGAR|nr:hypothetical protein BDV98DRAFT_587243 [Pterula gracilis]